MKGLVTSLVALLCLLCAKLQSQSTTTGRLSESLLPASAVAWTALRKEPDISEIAWFALTEHGMKTVTFNAPE